MGYWLPPAPRADFFNELLFQDASTELFIQMVLLIDCGLAVAALVAAFAFPRAGTRRFERCERLFGKLAQNSSLNDLTVGLTALALRRPAVLWR